MKCSITTYNNTSFFNIYLFFELNLCYNYFIFHFISILLYINQTVTIRDVKQFYKKNKTKSVRYYIADEINIPVKERL